MPSDSQYEVQKVENRYTMKYFIYLFFTAVSATSCHHYADSPARPTVAKDAGKYVQVKFTIDIHSPTVGISSYTLISNNLEKDSVEARQLIQSKGILPLAMQRHDAKLFDSTLAADFIYQGEEAFFNRAEYIKDRVNAKWMISDVQYENLVLLFFDGYGILTYRNKVKEKDEFGKDQLYTWFWTDVWIKENGRWKLKNLRAIN